MLSLVANGAANLSMNANAFARTAEKLLAAIAALEMEERQADKLGSLPHLVSCV